MNNNGITNLKPFALRFDLTSGKCGEKTSTKRYLTDMQGMYADEGALQRALEENDEMVYEFYELDLPKTSGNLLFGTSIIYPGKVGNEYFMTKGHFHQILDTAEVYYCLSGSGYMLMEDPEGNWDALKMTPGELVYVPGRYAHRSINTGPAPFILFFVYRADVGQDYKTIETKGYRKLIVEKNNKPEIVDNPRWK